jgi:hypothetical protein
MRLVRLLFALIFTITFASTASAQLLAPLQQIVNWTTSLAGLVWGTADQPHNTVWGSLAEAQ